jgi:hypothetical protein
MRFFQPSFTGLNNSVTIVTAWKKRQQQGTSDEQRRPFAKKRELSVTKFIFD